jgi:hypothetical protein
MLEICLTSGQIFQYYRFHGENFGDVLKFSDLKICIFQALEVIINMQILA